MTVEIKKQYHYVLLKDIRDAEKTIKRKFPVELCQLLLIYGNGNLNGYDGDYNKILSPDEICELVQTNKDFQKSKRTIPFFISEPGKVFCIEINKNDTQQVFHNDEIVADSMDMFFEHIVKH